VVLLEPVQRLLRQIVATLLAHCVFAINSIVSHVMTIMLIMLELAVIHQSSQYRQRAVCEMY